MTTVNLKYRLLAFFMAALMFLTSAGFLVDFHYCQGELKSFNFFGKAPNCHEMAMSGSCAHHKDQVAQ